MKIHVKEVEPREAGYHNSHRAYYYDMPCFKGYLTTDFNCVYGVLIRYDRFKRRQLAQYNIIKAAFNRLNPVRPGYPDKVMTLDAFNDILTSIRA